MGGEVSRKRTEDGATVHTVRAGNESEFGGLVERHRRELRVHCYRMLGSFDDAEDMVQETFLRAWRGRAGFEGRSTFRAWLYRIATNVCLDYLGRQPRSRQATNVGEGVPAPAAITWLQPFPDGLLEPFSPGEDEPEAQLVRKETIELAFLAAIQCLPPRQRAVLILRDVLGWPAKDTAELLESSVAAVNSALQRARPTLRMRLPKVRADWKAGEDPGEDEHAVLRKYMQALERSDDTALRMLLREDARCSQQSGAGGNMTPYAAWYSGRDTIIASWSPVFYGPAAVEFKNVPVRANTQPAFASYIRRPGEPVYQAFGITVLRVENGMVAEICVFQPDLFADFGLPAKVSEEF